MSRSLKKGPYVDENLAKKISGMKVGDRQTVKTWARASVIAPEFVGFSIGVHNGKEHIPVIISEEMVGHKLGEFSPTRKFRRHGGRMAKEQEKSATMGNGPAPAAKAPEIRPGNRGETSPKGREKGK